MFKKEKKEIKEYLQAHKLSQKADIDSFNDLQNSLAAAQDAFHVFIEKLGEPALILAKDDSILYANLSFFDMFDYHPEDVMGVSVLEFIQPEYRAYFTDYLKSQEKRKSEFHFIAKNNQIYTFSVSISKAMWEGAESYYVLMADITKLKRTQMLNGILESIIKMLSTTPKLEIALKQMIEILNSQLQWEIIVAWIWPTENLGSPYVEIAHVQDIDIDDFAQATRQEAVDNEKVNGGIWSTYRPFWIEDVTESSTFSRKKEALKNNIHGALAFPFYQHSQLGGVIELYRRKPLQEEVDDLMLNLITSIGIEFGFYIQRKIAEEAKLQFSNVIAYSVNGIFTLDANGIVKSWNPGAEKIYGWKAQEIIGSSIRKTIPNDRLEEFDELRKILLQGTMVEHFQTQRLHKDGHLIWVENAYGPINNPFGKAAEACVVVQDITSQKAAMDSLTRSEERFRTFVETTREWIWEIDKIGNFTFSNQAVLKILGYQVEEIMGKNILYYFFIEDRDKMEKLLKAHTTQKKGWVEQVMRFRHKNGTECWIESNASELVSLNHAFEGFRGASRDVTEFKIFEKIKDEFISMVSHEIRTPLTSIHGALTLLIQRELSLEDKKELLTTAKRNSDHLTNIISDIIDVENLQIGRMEFDFQKIKIKDVVLEAIKTSDIVAKKFNVKIFKDEVLSDVEVNGDFMRLVQVMTNLLSNAIKFSPPEGIIHISTEVEGDVVRVSVSDQGPGIPEEFRPKIFEKFVQADSSSKRSYQGTGLGLSISKSIIQGHGGTIQYRTKAGEGTTFFFELPKL